MKRTIALALTVPLSLAFASTAVAQDDAQPVKVGLSWNDYDVSLVYAWEKYMQDQGEIQGAEAGLDYEWVINAAGRDPARQAANIEDLINQDVDIIIARAEDAAAMGASIRAADEAGIPFVTFDRAATTATPAAHVGGDSYAQGVSTAEAFAEMLAAAGVEGKCIELQGSLTDVNAVNRSDAWNAVDAESDVFETVVQVPTEWDATVFLSGTANALQANPDANCIFVASDFAINSVESALEAAGKWAPTGDSDHIWLATQDLYPEALEAMEAGYVDVTTTYDAFAHAQEAVRVLTAVVLGEDPGCGEDGCLVAGRVATQENVADLESLWSRDFAE